MDYVFSEITNQEEIPEISSTTSRSKNMVAFKKKIYSRFLKYLTQIIILLFSFSLLVLVAVLARGGEEILHRLEFDVANISETVKNMSETMSKNMSATTHENIPEYYYDDSTTEYDTIYYSTTMAAESSAGDVAN